MHIFSRRLLSRVDFTLQCHWLTGYLYSNILFIYIYILKYVGPRRDLYYLIYLFCSYIGFIYVYVSSLLLSSENIYGTRPSQWELALFCCLKVFSWSWILYRGHPLFFLEFFFYLCLLYHSIFDMFFSLCVWCVGVILGFTYSYFSSFFSLSLFLSLRARVCVCV